jgi:hypothetical protein
VTSILVELKTLPASVLIAGIDSMVYARLARLARLARQGHSSDWLIHYLKKFFGLCLR